MNNKSHDNSFVAVGDVMLGDSAICVGFGLHSRYGRNVAPVFSKVAPLLRRGEVVLGNLECLLTRAGQGTSRYRTDQMRGDPEYAQALRAAGFTALAVANNHALQHGIGAFEETVASLRAAGIDCVGLRGSDGWCASPVVQVTAQKLRVGLLGYCWRPRQFNYSTPPYAEGDISAVETDVRRLATATDVVVVSLHWGEEFLDSPSASEVDFGHRIIAAGATLIVGHHPHAVRPVERHARGIVCYSLGNFVTDMLWQTPLRTGTVFECHFGRGEILEPRLTRTQVDRSFVTILDGEVIPIHSQVSGIDDETYRAMAARSVRKQQLAAYLYALRNAHRYPPRVLAELVGSTLRNKARGLIARVKPRHGVAPTI